MKTYFVQIVFNNEGKTFKGTRFLSAIVAAKNKEMAEEKILNHYRQYYTAGDNGEFYVQCNWIIHVPTREIIEKHWKKASLSMGAINQKADFHHSDNYRYFQIDKTKKEVLETWDYCNTHWANPAVHYSPEHGGYMVRLHNHMAMPSPFMLFKGNTKEVYDKAKQFVKDNTFKGDYYVKF